MTRRLTTDPCAQRRGLRFAVVPSAATRLETRMKKAPARKTARKSATPAKRAKAGPRRPVVARPTVADVRGTERRDVGHVRLEVGHAGDARVKRMIYPVGFR